jgi:hypothetical protein
MQRAIVDTFRKGARQRVPYTNAGWQMIADYFGKCWRENMERISETIRQFSIQTATGYQLDLMASQIPMTSDQLRARMSPPIVLTVPMYARIEDPLESDEAFIKRVIAAGRQPTEAEYIEAFKAGMLSPDDLPITLRFKLEDEGRLVGMHPALGAPFGQPSDAQILADVEAGKKQMFGGLRLTIPGVIDTPIEGISTDEAFEYTPYAGAQHHNISQVLPQAEFERIYGKPIEPIGDGVPDPAPLITGIRSLTDIDVEL